MQRLCTSDHIFRFVSRLEVDALRSWEQNPHRPFLIAREACVPSAPEGRHAEAGWNRHLEQQTEEWSMTPPDSLIGLRATKAEPAAGSGA